MSACSDEPASDGATRDAAADVAIEVASGCPCPAPTNACVGVDGQHTITPTCLDNTCVDVPSDSACAATTGVCLDESCVTVPVLCDWPFGPRTSIVSVFALGDQSSTVDPASGERDDACCEDFDDDGHVDDKLGKSFADTRDLLVDINPYFEGQIRDGHFNLLFDVRDLDSLVDDDHVRIIVYESFVVPTNNDIPSGNASFVVKPRSWFDGTVRPRLYVDGRISDGRLVVDQGDFAFFFAGATSGVVELPLDRFHLEGTLAEHPGKPGLDMALTLGGLIDPSDLAAVLNNEVAFSCSCKYADGVPPIDPSFRSCNAPMQGSTCAEDGAFCMALTDENLCPSILELFAPDVDTDQDQVPDRISAGVFMTATSATIDHLEMTCGP